MPHRIYGAFLAACLSCSSLLTQFRDQDRAERCSKGDEVACAFLDCVEGSEADCDRLRCAAGRADACKRVPLKATAQSGSGDVSVSVSVQPSPFSLPSQDSATCPVETCQHDLSRPCLVANGQKWMYYPVHDDDEKGDWVKYCLTVCPKCGGSFKKPDETKIIPHSEVPPGW